MDKSKIIKFIVILLTFLFFVGIAVVTIIIARGGLITKEGVVLDTSIIHIQTEPTDAKLKFFLNKQPVDVSDNRITGLLKGTYNVRIESEGYTPWEKDIVVDQGVVIEVYARLYPLKLSLTQITKTNVDRAFFSSDGEYVYYVVSNTEIGTDKGIWKLRLGQSTFFFSSSDNTPVKLADLDPKFTDAITAGAYEIVPSLDANKILFKDNKSGATYILDGNNFNNKIPDSLEATLGYKPDGVYWFNGSNSLIVHDKSLLFEHNLTNNVDTVISYSKDAPLVFAVGNSEVFIYDSVHKNLLGYKNQKPEDVTLVNTSLPDSIQALYTPLNNARFLILKTDKNYQYLDLDKSLLKDITTSGDFLSFALDGRAALFLKDKGIYSYVVKELVASNSVDTAFVDTGMALNSPNSLIRFIPQSTHILLYENSDKHTITVAEKDGGNKLILLNNPDIKNADFDFDSAGNNLIVLIKDEGTPSSSGTRANLYRINLKTQ